MSFKGWVPIACGSANHESNALVWYTLRGKKVLLVYARYSSARLVSIQKLLVRCVRVKGKAHLNSVPTGVSFGEPKVVLFYLNVLSILKYTVDVLLVFLNLKNLLN